MKRSRTLSIELLEDRVTPATYANPWPDGAHLTLSFAPDGAAVGPYSSSLFQSLNTATSTAIWQREILRAFQTWAVQANINIGLVADQGQAMGSPGLPQGDERFGDIRLSAIPMASEMAIASPFEPTSSTWAGDVKFNTNQLFSLDGSKNTADLFTVALHEAGHALGLAHDTAVTSVMYDGYLGTRTGPSSADIAKLQALYGPRLADAFEGAKGNSTIATARPVSLLKNGDGTTGIAVEADVTATSDIDIYKFTTPLNPGALAVRVQTSGLSLLTAKVSVLDSAGKVLATATTADPLKNDLQVTLKTLSALKTYYIKVQSGRTDVFGRGAYRLGVRLAPQLSTALGSVTTSVSGATTTLLNNDLHTNDTILTAALLPVQLNQTNSRFDYAFRGSISDSWDVDFYRITAPTPPAGAANVMSVMVWGMRNGGLIPTATVFDSRQQAVATEVLVNEAGVLTVQVANAVAGATYFVKVAANQPSGANNVGNYFLGVDFSTRAVQLATFVQATLDAGNRTAGTVLTVNETQLFHLVLGAEALAAAAVRLTIFNTSGAVISTLTTTRGKFVSHTQHLVPGQYGFRFDAFAVNGTPLPTIGVTLRGLALTDPIGPASEDCTEAPSSGSTMTPSDPQYSYSDTSTCKPTWYETYDSSSYPYQG